MIKNKISNGTIYLSGGGDAEKTIDLDMCFLKNLPGKEILFIPIAKTTRSVNGYRKKREWITNKLNELSKKPLNISMILDLDKYKNIDNFSAVYIGGGNAYKLATFMKKSGFQVILKKYIDNGGIVYGASAGAIFMGKDISTHNEKKYIIENQKFHYGLTAGLGIIGNYSLMVHFLENEYEQLNEYFQDKYNPVIAIPEGVGLVVKGKQVFVVGSKGVTIFHKNGISEKIDAGSYFYCKD
ncbi:MAG: Type 1 glutamine amidotransferase-like domain-containing protein [Patescibacteria group bacterium]